MEIIFTRDRQWLAKWDAFIAGDDKGCHLLFSDWALSYRAYGFEAEFCLAIENGNIIGGYAAVIAKAFFFKFYIVPYGPIATSGFENAVEKLTASVPGRAKIHNAAYAHIALPVAKAVANTHVFDALSPTLSGAHKGHLFNYVYSNNGLNWIDLAGFDEESKIMTLKPAMRRNIRNSYRKGLEFCIMDTREKLEEGYNLFIRNSHDAGYTIRNWSEMRETLFAMLEKNTIKMLAAYKDGELKGAILLVKAGNYYTYVLGGSKKEVPDLRTGDFLQWEAVKLSLNEGLDGYNISLGGSKGVVEFKNSFNTHEILFADSKFHWILKPRYFRAYQIIERKLRPHKKKISTLLSRIKR